ncbi:hypothetical protein [Acidiferrobacter sp.]|uniref:hypothetical protein n=1 Tax=Acidiferrobacter sp. TaxID=1872107 RepID=UPI0026232DE4|nr:hypothetical protein [Acidiferrobacter sp.]
MRIFSRLERRFGRYAVANLMAYIIGVQGLVFLMARTPQGPHILANLRFDPALIARGEVWRLVSFVAIPPSFSIWAFFILYLYYIFGARLEEEWGDFRFNVYYLSGVVLSVIGAFLAGASATATYLNLSLFLAFATIDPEFSILLFFVIPVKVKYLAWLAWLAVAFAVLFEPLPIKVMVGVSLLNYFVFFGEDIRRRVRAGIAFGPRRSRFRASMHAGTGTPIHRCTVCGATEHDDPKLEFRYCSKCAGHHEYCLTHLGSHDHIQ